jgi:hypothetical protein
VNRAGAAAGQLMGGGTVSLPGSSYAIDINITAARSNSISTAMRNSLITFSSGCGHVQSLQVLKIYHAKNQFLRAAHQCAGLVVSQEQTLSHDQNHQEYPHIDHIQQEYCLA